MALSHRPSQVSPPPNDSLSAARVAFPQTPEEFEGDPRISYSKVEEKWILEDDDGSEWEYAENLKRWIPSLDEAQVERQGSAYAVEGVDESQSSEALRKKRNRDDQENSGKLSKKSRGDAQKQERKNTAIYVTSLPLDTTVDEVHSVFSKCGVISEEIDERKPRIKLYTDDEGTFKGDALIVYFRAESVNLAIQMLDDSDFRFGQTGPAGKMRVKEAEFSYKKQKDAPEKKNVKDQKKIIKKTQRLNNKLADWDDDDPQAIQETNNRWDKVVILKHMFTLQELQEDPAAALDIKEDIREECSNLGDVTNVVLFDREQDGVASVRFGNAEAAKACVRLMDGRMFDGRKVVAYVSDGEEKFKKTTKKLDAEEADDRLDEFGRWLEEDDDAQRV